MQNLPLVGGAIVPAGSGRSIFALPWLGHTLVGTTDNDYEGPLDHIEPSDADVHYLLDAVNEFFGRALTPADLTGAFAGVRPLISTGDPKKSVDISRKAELYETSSGMITITGGKLTTWRRMAKMTVDRIVEREARDAPCRTNEIPLGQAIAVQELQRVEGVPEESYAALASRYGHAAHDVLALAGARGELAQPIVDGLPDLLAEVALAARREQALSIGDALLRRTRLGLLAARELAGPVADGSSPGPPTGRSRVSPTCSPASSAGMSRGRTPSSRRLRARRAPRGSSALDPGRGRRRRTCVPPARRGAHARAGPASDPDGDRQRVARLLQRRRGPPHARGSRSARAASCGPTVPRSSTSAASRRRPADRLSTSRSRSSGWRLWSSAWRPSRSSRSTPTSRTSHARRSPPARASSTTSAGCVTRSWPWSAPRAARRSS